MILLFFIIFIVLLFFNSLIYLVISQIIYLNMLKLNRLLCNLTDKLDFKRISDSYVKSVLWHTISHYKSDPNL